MIWETRDEGMPIVQVEMYLLAERADRTGDVEHVPQSASYRILDFCDQIRQPAVLGVKVPETQARMAARELRRRLPDADMADVDAATDAFSVVEPLRHLDEPPRLQARSVLEKDKGAARPLAQTRIELPHHSKQAVCLCLHLTFVMDDEAGDTACEVVGEFPDHGAATFVQHVDVAVQVDHRQVRMRGHELQDMLKLVWRVRIYLGSQAHLGEAEPSKLKQRIVPCDASLE